MAKYMTGYCHHCGKTTKHQVIECEDSVPYRIFETVATLGFGAMLEHDYKCECAKCGNITTLER
jgi:hypothetical protein